MADEDRVQELYIRFLDTDEMQDWEEFVEKARKALKADPNAESVTVPAAFLRRVMIDISTTPHMFDALRDRFNQLCDEMGMPEEKDTGGAVLTLNPGAEDMVSRRKFSVRSRPIHYKDRPQGAEGGDDDKEGPF